MNKSKSLESMASELIRRGLPADYSARAAAELADHHRDLIEELKSTGWSDSQAEMEASRRLGDTQTLVKKTVRAYQRRYWCGRWPTLAFLFVPIPTMVVLWITTGFVSKGILVILESIGVVHIDDSATGPLSPEKRAIVFGIVTWCLLVLPVFVTIAFARLAKRARLDGRWLVIASCVVALFAGSIDFYRGPGFHSAAEAAAGTAPTMMYWLNMPFFDAPFWARMPGSLFRLYTRGIFQPYQTLLPVVLAAILLLRSKQLALRAERRLVHGC